MTRLAHRASELVSGPRIRLLLAGQLVLVVCLVATLYTGVIVRLVATWWDDPGYSHGFLIPPLAAFIAWWRRDLTLAQPAVPDGRGLAGVAAACALFLAGKLGAEFFLTRVSLIVLLAGVIWTFWGRNRLQTLLFPLILLVTMIPIPAILYNLAAGPLQLFASRVSADIVQALGVPSYRDGNILQLPQMTIGVAEACSGLRSVSSLTVLAMLVALLYCTRLLAKTAVVLLAVPIALAVNVFRIAGTALLTEYNQQLALGFYHSFSGWLVFLMGFGLLLGVGKALHALLDRGSREH
jgi:exosortase